MAKLDSVMMIERNAIAKDAFYAVGDGKKGCRIKGEVG